MDTLKLLADGIALERFVRDLCLPIACVICLLLPLRGLLGPSLPRVRRAPVSRPRHPRPL